MKTLEIAALAMQGDMERLAHIGQNLANVQTPGYKRTVAVQRPFEPHFAEALGGTGTALDARAGALRATGDSLDLAIEGEGFFAVQGKAGRALARQLSLRVGAGGTLVNDAGQAVLGDRGEVHVDSVAGALRVDAQGEVFAGERSLGRLQLWRVPDAALRPQGGGLYEAEEAQLQPLDAPRVRAGYQESSNVNSAAEMVRLMETTRHFEAVARTAQGYDEAMEKAIRKLGDL